MPTQSKSAAVHPVDISHAEPFRKRTGAYPEAESGLSKLALEWMVKEAVAVGLLADNSKIDLVLGRSGGGYVSPNAQAMMHESLTGLWRLVEFVPKRHYDWSKSRATHRANLFRRRTIPLGSLIHQSAYERGKEYESRLPTDAVRIT